MLSVLKMILLYDAFATPTQAQINELAIQHLDNFMKDLWKIGDDGFMKDSVVNKRQSMINAEIEKFRAELSEKFPGNDEIEVSSELLQSACNKAFDTFLTKYKDALATSNLYFNLYSCAIYRAIRRECENPAQLNGQEKKMPSIFAVIGVQD
ncbi:unnamed protein product [Clavelina lepadiformis]|uniref:Uncharacterized protein n=1 Tax=Clavelina lepadiformis TaxID=159417 RepID=A0ABP0GQ44_CLALP